ncbi:hypothetical protein G9A89_014038 [Geosiphon pyriformis]|nr:hypothetical protein G9A89_014038 [Geosiphon pyriformis]
MHRTALETDSNVEIKDPFGSNKTFTLPNFIPPPIKEVSISERFLSSATLFTAHLYCPDISETPILLEPEKFIMIETFMNFQSPLDPKQIIDVIFATFKTPELSYDQLDSMGETPELIDVPYQNWVNAMILRRFYIKYWSLAANQTLKMLTQYVDNNIKYDKYTLVLTGHGGGAVLATFAAIIFNKFWPKRQVILITYGAPRIGNDIFVRYMQKRIWVERVTVHDDYAPLFFGDNYLTHTSMETWIVPDQSCDCWKRYEDDQIELYEGKDSFYRCTSPVGMENKNCNLRFENSRSTYQVQQTTAHLGPYFGFFMSREGCGGGRPIRRENNNF